MSYLNSRCKVSPSRSARTLRPAGANVILPTRGGVKLVARVLAEHKWFRLALTKDIQLAVRSSASLAHPAADGSSELAWEIIVVDDASPDGTQEVARELAKVYGEDKIVRVTLREPSQRAERTAGSETTSRKARVGCVGSFRACVYS